MQQTSGQGWFETFFGANAKVELICGYSSAHSPELTVQIQHT
jgi:hypothetical protein